MSERYWITGAQLGLIKTGYEHIIKETVDNVIENQFIGNYRTDKEQKAFKEEMDRK